MQFLEYLFESQNQTKIQSHNSIEKHIRSEISKSKLKIRRQFKRVIKYHNQKLISKVSLRVKFKVKIKRQFKS